MKNINSVICLDIAFSGCNVLHKIRQFKHLHMLNACLCLIYYLVKLEGKCKSFPLFYIDALVLDISRISPDISNQIGYLPDISRTLTNVPILVLVLALTQLFYYIQCSVYTDLSFSGSH